VNQKLATPRREKRVRKEDLSSLHPEHYIIMLIWIAAIAIGIAALIR
jgi:hypothetical protein